MARALRPNIAGATYHAMARGNGRQRIYIDDEDRELFMRLLERTCQRYRWECLAYCLMGNHYHLVVRTPLPNLSRGMRLLNGGYASRFNARRNRPGHLFQGRYRSVVIRDSEHLLHVLKYVIRNPVTAELCTEPEDWRWSSYHATLAETSAGLVAVDAALRWFGENGEAPHRFARFMQNDDNALLRVGLDGRVAFPVEAVVADGRRPALEEVLAKQPGAAGIALAYRDHGYSLREIAEVLGCSRPVAGRRLVAYEAEQMLDRAT